MSAWQLTHWHIDALLRYKEREDS